MQADEALTKWGYPNTRKKKAQLKELCNIHPELCKKTNPSEIKEKSIKPYLPSHKNKDIYSHIVYAVRDNAHLFPESFHIDNAHLKRHIKELCGAGILVKLPNNKKNCTENYAITIKAEPWLKKRLSQKIKCITDAIGPIKPDFVINNVCSN